MGDGGLGPSSDLTHPAVLSHDFGFQQVVDQLNGEGFVGEFAVKRFHEIGSAILIQVV